MEEIHVVNFHYDLDFTVSGDLITVGQLKSAIYRRCGISEDLQILVTNGLLLKEDSWELEDYGLHGDLVSLFQKMMPQPIRVRFVWKEFQYVVQLSSTDPVRKLKRQFEREGGGLPPHRQSLICMGADMYDDEKLDVYAIEQVVFVGVEEILPNPDDMMTVNVLVVRTGEESEFMLDERDTMYTLYNMVKQAGLADGVNWYFVLRGERVARNQQIRNLNLGDGDDLFLELP